MKKLVQIVSFSAVLCLCCCFSTFGSVKVSAADVSPDALNNWFLLPFNEVLGYDGSFNTDSGTYFCDLPSLNRQSINFYVGNSGAVLPKFESNREYLIYSTVSLVGDADLNRFFFREDSSLQSTEQRLFPISSFKTFVNSTTTLTHYFNFKPTRDYQLSTGSFIYYELNAVTSFSGRFSYAFYALDITDSSEDEVNSIIAAINNQTGALQGSIGQAADDIQQSIEDQYQMEDEEDFGFSDIQEQYEEKMGVLTFGTETTLQMLDLFSPSNAGEAYIRVPGFSIDVQGESYRVWDDYVFRFAWIEEWIPLLVRLMRTFNITMFYIAILSYINKVYERNFLAK